MAFFSDKPLPTDMIPFDHSLDKTLASCLVVINRLVNKTRMRVEVRKHTGKRAKRASFYYG